MIGYIKTCLGMILELILCDHTAFH